jgi:thiosulfate/3-mercaptopyruvate sulfurtransferase
MLTRRRSMQLFAVIAAAALVAACATVRSQQKATLPAIDSLVTAEWLSQHLADPDLVVLDCTVRVERDKDQGLRTVSGRAGYERGHIPNAAFADLTGDLAAANPKVSFALPTPEQFAAAMGALGVGDDSRVVLYSANQPAWAARVWWMLRWIGFDRAAVLDGGLKAWTAEGRLLSTEPASRPATRLTVALRPKLIADQNEVRAALGNHSVTLVDALPEASFQGKMAMYGRPGHLPGAVNVPASNIVDSTGRYLPRETLAAMPWGSHTGRAITYCGGGIAASSDAFVMTRLGYTDVAVYINSLQEWTADPANPMEVGPPK